MKQNYALNKHSELILNIGMAVCILAYFGVFLHSYFLSQHEILKISEISQMLENVTMSLLIVVLSSLLLDIHIKRT